MMKNTEYGNAVNGINVGSGFDVIIKRESRFTAVLNVISLPSKTQWLGPIGVGADQDLQALAVEIGNCPGPWLNDLPSDDPKTPWYVWNAVVERWNRL
jgi:hypothetical protein